MPSTPFSQMSSKKRSASPSTCSRKRRASPGAGRSAFNRDFRSTSGRRLRSSPSRWRRSNAKQTAGEVRASFSACAALATWILGWMSWKRARPSSSVTQISPSRATVSAGSAATSRATSGNWRASEFPRRENRRTSPFTLRARTRIPSSLSSFSHRPFSRVGSSTGEGSMGSIQSGSLEPMDAMLPPPAKRGEGRGWPRLPRVPAPTLIFLLRLLGAARGARLRGRLADRGRRRDGGGHGRRALARPLGERLLEDGHEVRDPRRRRGLAHRRGREAGDLLADDLVELLAVVVLVARDVEGPRHAVDEALGELELLGPPLLDGRELELGLGPHLVREAHDLEDDPEAVGLDAAEVLARPHDELGDAHLVRLLEGVAEERERPLAALLGLEVARALEELGVDLGRLHELLDVDRRAALDVGLVEVVVGEGHPLPVGVLESLHDVAPGDLLAAGLAGPLVADPPLVLRVEEVELRLLVLVDRGVEVDGDRDEPEAHEAFPGRSHSASLLGWRAYAPIRSPSNARGAKGPANPHRWLTTRLTLATRHFVPRRGVPSRQRACPLHPSAGQPLCVSQHEAWTVAEQRSQRTSRSSGTRSPWQKPQRARASRETALIRADSSAVAARPASSRSVTRA